MDSKGKRFTLGAQVCIFLCLTILFVTCLKDKRQNFFSSVVKAQYELFHVVKETQCTSGLLEPVDKYRIEGDLDITSQNDTPNEMSFSYVAELPSGFIKPICVVDLEQQCVRSVPPETLGCYCLQANESRVTVVLRVAASRIVSNSTYHVTWRQDYSVQVPKVYALNSTKVGYIQDIALSNYSTPCQFTVAKDRNVRYCCKNTAQPCTSFIEYDGAEVSHGSPCAVFKMEEKRYSRHFRFYHTVCGQLGVSFSCNVYSKSAVVIRMKTERSPDAITGLLILAGSLLGLVHLGIAGTVCYLDKHRQL